MDEKSIESNLNTLKETVLDEGKLVTYISLSKDLCLHVNHCKTLLQKLVEKIRNERPEIELNVSYIISGLIEDNKARTTVASEKELSCVRKNFKDVFYEHIYSVAVGPFNIDNVAFIAISRFEDFPLCMGQIRNSDCVKRTSDEISSLKHKSQSSIIVEQKQAAKVIKKENKDMSKNVAHIHEVKSEPTIKIEVPSPSKESAQANSKQPQESKKNGNKAQKGIAGFFTKSASAPTKKAMKDFELNGKDSKKDLEHNENVKDLKQNETNVNEKVDIEKQTQIKEEKMDIDDDESKAKLVKPYSSKDKTKGKSVSQIKKHAKVDKKRKRVLHISDSESDSEKDPFADEPEVKIDHESEDEIPPTPTVNPVKISSGLVNPKKKRKVIDKTYTDDEGYILTKKEVVYESCSENEEEVHSKENTNDHSNHNKPEKVPKLDKSPTGKEKKNCVKNSKKKISPPQKGKQATLMNFFKKV